MHTWLLLFIARPQHIEEDEQEIEPPKKKARRVLPEHEGKYKVIMPAGTTPRTQKILSNIGSLGGRNLFYIFSILTTCTLHEKGPVKLGLHAQKSNHFVLLTVT
jgi:hypothetical protein